MASRVRYQLIMLIFVVSAVVYIDRSNMSIAGLDLIKDYGGTTIQLGWLQSAFLLGYAFFQIPAGWVVGKLGPHKTLTIGLLWWSALTIATAIVPPGMAHALWVLIAVRFILGLGESVAYPSSNQFIAAWFPTQERGKANGWVFGGVGLGSGTAPLAIGAIVLNYGWHMAFYVSAVIGLVMCVVWYRMARNTPAEHPRVTPAELAHIKAGLPVRMEGAMPPVPWKKIFTSADMWFVTLAYVAFGYVAFLFHTWFFPYVKGGLHFDMKSSIFLSVLPFVAMTVCCLAGGAASDWVVKRSGQYIGRSIFGACTLFATCALMLIGGTVTDPYVAIGVLTCAAGALYFGQATYWAVGADFGGPYSGIVSGLINMGGQIAGAVTASATPWFAREYGWSTAFYVAAAVAFVCGFFWFFVHPDRRLIPPVVEA
jgi:MFS transporter, ACS family, glucarate transporter